MNKEKLKRLKALAQAATKGPWTLKPPKDTGHKGYGICDSSGNLIIFHVRGFDEWQENTYRPCGKTKLANAEYLAVVDPDTILDLIAEIERLQANANSD